MSTKITLNSITAGHGSMDLINSNFVTIANEIDLLVSRDGSSPNTMTADLDMNGNTILNYVGPSTWDMQTADWATSTAYAVGDVVYVTVATDASNGGASYYCLTAHTSGTFSTDLAAVKWRKVSARGATGASGSGSGDLIASNNLSDVASSATSRINLGIDGSSANIATGDLADDAVTLAKIAAGTDGELITWDASGDPATVAVGTSGHILTSNGAGAAPTFQANASAPTVVTQAQMETATNNTAMVTPTAVKWQPGVAKAWVYFDGTQSGTIAATASHNISSVVKNSTGKYTITFTTAFSATTAYIGMGSARLSTDTAPEGCHIVSVEPTAASTCIVYTVDNQAEQMIDNDMVMVTWFGDFA